MSSSNDSDKITAGSNLSISELLAENESLKAQIIRKEIKQL